MTKILLIEDDEMLVHMYKRVFELENIEVITAFDGEDGLAQTLSEHPDIILLDVMMPKMDGMQVLLRLKSNEVTQEIPVIVLTNLAGTKDAKSADYMGAVKYLIKSEYEPKQVADIVKEILVARGKSEFLNNIII